jgi:tetratricopeptide (TPR) repeat protein
MMITNKLNTTLKCFGIACFLLAFMSCSDAFFDVEVGERLTSEEYWESYEDAENSFYGTMVSMMDVAPNLILVDGLRSDQMIANSTLSGDLLEIANLNFRDDNEFFDQAPFYQVIINVNETLANIDTAAALDDGFSDGELYDMKAAMYGLRAWVYLTLVRNYEEVNWIADNLEVLPESATMLGKEELLDTLISGFLNDSMVYDLLENTTSRTENVYQNLPNYKAVLGELYLEQGDYENAIDFFIMGLNTIPSGLTSSTAYKVASYSKYSWYGIFVNAQSQTNENMFVIPYDLGEQQENTMVQYFMPDDEYSILPAQHLIDSMEYAVQSTLTDTGDIYRGYGYTYSATYDIDSTSSDGISYYSNFEYYISKYSLDEGDEYDTDIILQRAGGVHLLLAEALNRNGRSDDALMLLNNGISNEASADRPSDMLLFYKNLGIRGRVYLAPRVVPDSITGTEKVEMIEDWILQEKSMECAFEGTRMSDLIRVAERRDNPEEFLGELVARKYDDESMQATVKAFYSDQSNWYLP